MTNTSGCAAAHLERPPHSYRTGLIKILAALAPTVSPSGYYKTAKSVGQRKAEANATGPSTGEGQEQTASVPGAK